MAASASEIRSFEADSMAPGVTRCAIEVSTGQAISLQPVFVGSADIAGQYSFIVASVTNGGRSQTHQANGFSQGRIDGPMVRLGAASQVEAVFTVIDAQGAALCSVEIDHPVSHLVQLSTSHSGGLHG